MVDDRATRDAAKSRAWIGVDLDGTLFTYHQWVGWNVFGEPIAPMIERVRRWIAEGKEVRIVTARVGLPFQVGTRDKKTLVYSGVRENFCRVTREPFSDEMTVNAVQDHLERHGLPRLLVQCFKDVDMIELWDDRAVQVVPNTGRTLAEEHEAEASALRGKAQGEPTDDHYMDRTGNVRTV